MKSEITVKLCLFLVMVQLVYETQGAATESGHKPTCSKKGWQAISDNRENKGLTFTKEERDSRNIRGLLPPRVYSKEEQLEWCVKAVERIPHNLDKYVFLRDLQDANEHLFYHCLVERTSIMLPIIYTPTVGLACQYYGYAFRRPRGMFISIDDKGHIEKILRNWPETDVRAVVVTDGERILGLGDQGANGMGIPVGKMAIYTAIGGVRPEYSLPVTLDVGTNNQELLSDSSRYVGIPRRRVTGPEYVELVDEFMNAVVKVYGKQTLIQFEDFSAENAMRFLSRYRQKFTMFNDDLQGTGAVTVAGLLTVERFTNMKLSESKVFFVGAGGAAGGISLLIMRAMELKDANKRIFMKRSTGLLRKGCSEGNYKDYEDPRGQFCHEYPAGINDNDLVDVIRKLKPNILIGVSGVKGIFSPEVLGAMAEVSEQPIILPLSNPTDNSECTPEQAYTHTNNKCIFASGSPFPPVTVNGVTKVPMQCNNAYIFPGVAMAVVAARMSTVPWEVFYVAAKALSNCVTQEEFDQGSIYPSFKRIRECSIDISTSVVEYAYANGLATLKPKPNNIKEFIRSHQYNPLERH